MLITPGDFRGFDFGEMGQNIVSEIPDLTHIAVSPENFPSGRKENLQPYRAPAEDELRWLCYTSGTTADP
ncbi:MAG: cyclohexanecarboxylate-CoA ligase, partial [Actinomycetota bacterium]|nr:cyclohexanecarboxylate-CoA ligase [Actinomycetota bacterium]